MKPARLFNRAFDIDLEYGPHRGGEELKLFAGSIEHSVGDAQARALPYKASRRLHAFSAAGSL